MNSAGSLARRLNFSRKRAEPRQRQIRTRLGSGREDVCPYSVLEIERDATRAEIRAAYLQKMKELHPDVNVADTTTEASLVNLAYEILCSNSKAAVDIAGTDEGWQTKDEFDDPTGMPTMLFVNPFRCSNVNPLEWRALQALAKTKRDPREALTEKGVSLAESAISYLTPGQIRVIEMELDRIETTLDYGFCEWTLDDYLTRARRSNQTL